MKAPNLKSFPEKDPENSFEARAQQVQEASKSMVRRSFTITQENADKIQQVAMQMSQERNKLVSASEALRFIIEAYEVN